MCPSSGLPGETTLHTRQSSTQSDNYQVSHRYSYFCWWWAHSCPKYVEKRNKYTKKNCEQSWLYLQDYTGMHGQ